MMCRRVPTSVLLSVASIAVMPPARAQQATPQSAPAAENEIVVVGEQEQQNQIDRRVYLVKDNPRTQASNGLDVLGNVPTVNVTPNGRVQLLGSAVKILIDGKEVPDATTTLRNLQGSQIAKVELMSNPSAQYSASGTGGIINIVLRRPSGETLKASLLSSISSFGSYELKASPTWSSGRWSANGSLGWNRGVYRSSSERTREDLSDPQNPATNVREWNSSRGNNGVLSGNLLIAFKPTKQQDLSFSAIAMHATGDSRQTTLLRNATGDVRQDSAAPSRLNSRTFSLSYANQFNEKGKKLSLSATSTSYDWTSDGRFASGNGANFVNENRTRGDTQGLKIDFTNPWTKDRRLSIGAALDLSHRRIAQTQGGSNALGANVPVTASDLDGRWTDLAAYITYQAPVAGWKLMPGLRLERREYRLQNERADTGLFPTLHLERKLDKRLTLDLSYSRRIFRPDILNLDPALRYTDATTASKGNPDLRPEITDSIEAKLDLRAGKHTAVLTLYRRVTHDPWVNATSLTPSGTYVTTSINLGSNTRSGGNLSLQGPLTDHLRYSASGNLYARTYDGGGIAPSDPARAEYSGSLQLEYSDHKEGRTGSDNVTLDLRYYSATDNVLSRSGSFRSTDVTWTHGLTDRLVSVLKVSNPFGDVTFRSSSASQYLLDRETSRLPGPTFRLSLTYRVGAQ